MKKTLTFLFLPFGLSLSFWACDDNNYKLPVGNFCAASGECEAGLCSYGRCLDPLEDDDNDGLSNALEAALGSNPFSADTDGDGILDKDEVGPNGEPIDTDGDGIPDILESAILDRDGDCLPDQYDPDDAKKATAEELQEWGAYLCSQDGVCKGQEASIIVSCNDEALVSCDYSAVPDYAEDELCDGLDNNCDGEVDEGHPDQDGDGVADCVDPDRDGDGVLNDEDNCPDVPNPQQEDANGNGRGDACDPPNVPVLTGFSKPSPGSGEVVTLLGTGDPHSRTLIFEDATCESEIGRGQVGDDGSWEAEATLHEGENQFYLRAKNRFDLESSCVLGGLSFVRDESLPSDPSVGVVVAIDWDGDEETISSKARFRIEGELAGGGRALAYADPDCSEAIGEAEAPEGAFVIESDWVNSDQKTLYMAGETEAGVKGECIAIQSLFGEIVVPTESPSGTPIPGIPMQIHYPDGAPASPLVLSESTGSMVFQGFLAGSTVTMREGRPSGCEWEVNLLSFAHLQPDEDFAFPKHPSPDEDPGEADVQEWRITLFLPESPDNVDLIHVFLPGGKETFFYPSGNETMSFWIEKEHFHGNTFDLMLLAINEDEAEPVAYIVRQGLPLPGESADLEIDLTEEAWQDDLWVENELVVDSDGLHSGGIELNFIAENGDALGFYDPPNYDLNNNELNIMPGENRLLIKTPPLPGLRSRLLFSIGEKERDAETKMRAWASPYEGEVLPFHLGVDTVLDLFPAMNDFGLQLEEASDGLMQYQANFQHSGTYASADLIMVAILARALEGRMTHRWFYFQKGNALRELSFPRLTEDWDAYAPDLRKEAKGQLAGLAGIVYAFEYVESTPFKKLFQDLEIASDLSVLVNEPNLLRALIHMHVFLETAN